MRCVKPAKIRPVVKIVGGKFYQIDHILSNLPEHSRFVEVCGGGGSITLNKPPSQDIWNDLDTNLYDIFYYVKWFPQQFIERLRELEYSEKTFLWAKELVPTKPFENAIKHYCLYRMSRGGMCKHFAYSNRLRGGQPGDINAWITSLDNLEHVANRLSTVQIRNQDFEILIYTYDSESTVFLIDPPYVKSTRVSKQLYRLDWDESEHHRLASVVNDIRGKCIICGYPSELYDTLFKGWRKEYKQIRNHASQSKQKELKTEVLYMNFTC
mgnify:CR=1 FL=1